jgi:hypothetical protein
MAENARLTPLQLRRQLLVARCENQRRTLAVEVARIRQATAWLPPAARSLRGAAPWLVVAAPIAGFLLVRNWRGLRQLATKAVVGWRFGVWLWHLLSR